MAGENDHVQGGDHLLEHLEHLDAVHVLHLQIHDRNVEIPGAQRADRLRTARCGRDLEAAPSESLGQHLEVSHLVVHQQQTDRFRVLRHGVSLNPLF